MTKLQFSLITLVLLPAVFIGTAQAAMFEFHNDTETLKTVNLFWVDHNFDSLFPVGVTTAEIKPGKSFYPEFNRRAGIYDIFWTEVQTRKITNRESIKTTSDTKRCVSKPSRTVCSLD